MERLRRFGKKMSRHKSGNTIAEQKTRKIQKMRSNVSSECRAEEVKDCRTKSQRKWNTQRQKKACSSRGRNMTCGCTKMKKRSKKTA